MRLIQQRKKIICMVLALVIVIFAMGILIEQKALSVEAKMISVQRRMAKEVLRFHVLANSDSKEDQALKLQVKEQVLNFMKEELPESDSAGMTKAWASAHLEEIEETAEKIIREQGYNYAVHAEVTTCYFPEKTYGDVTFPKGEYEALRIEIGEAEGQNWWCVLYPNLCFIDAVHAVVPEEGKKELKSVLDEEEYEMVTATTRFKIRWFFFR